MYITAYIQVPLVFPCAFHFLMIDDKYPGRLTLWNYKHDALKNKTFNPLQIIIYWNVWEENLTQST